MVQPYTPVHHSLLSTRRATLGKQCCLVFNMCMTCIGWLQLAITHVEAMSWLNHQCCYTALASERTENLTNAERFLKSAAEPCNSVCATLINIHMRHTMSTCGHILCTIAFRHQQRATRTENKSRQHLNALWYSTRCEVAQLAGDRAKKCCWLQAVPNRGQETDRGCWQ